MHSTSQNIFEPQVSPPGMYPTSIPVPSPMVKYPILNTNFSATQPPPLQGPPIATHMLITTQSLIYGDMPIQCTCPHCHQMIITRVEKKTGLVSWLVCGGIVLVGGWLGCCLIPFCVDSLKVIPSIVII